MAIPQGRSKRKYTGKRYKFVGQKKLRELGRRPSLTKVSERQMQAIRARGGNKKYRLMSADTINVYDKKTKKHHKIKIKTVLENPANRHYVRQNILTKGTVVETEKGKARITSRPGQDGTVNAVLI